MTRCTRRTRPAPNRARCSHGARVLFVSAELDIATASRLARRLADAPSIRALYLSQVTFIDSAGLRAIVEATRADPNLAIEAPPACVRRLSTIAGVDEIFRRGGI
jgi:anti-anti-sigma factor